MQQYSQKQIMCAHDAEHDSKYCVFSFLKMLNINSNLSGPQIS